MAAVDSGAALQAGLRALTRKRLDGATRSTIIARRFVYGGTAVYALLFIAIAAAHVESFSAARTDLGYMVQAVWSTAHGHFLGQTSLTGQESTRLVGHVDPFLALLVPFWLVWPSALMLLVVQALAVASGALPVYWLGRKHLGSERAAVHFAFAYLLFPATQFNALTIMTGFHAVSVAVPFILFAIWFLDEERLVLFAAFALLAMSTKEEIGAAVGCLGIWYAVRKGRRWVGAAIFAAGMTVTLVDFLVIIPHFSPSGVDPFVSRYAKVGGTPGGILHKAVTDPAAFLQAVTSGHKILYLVLLLAPFLGMWALEPLLFLGAVPDLAINLLSSHRDQTSIIYHWTAGIVPFTVAASVLGAARLKRNPDSLSLAALVGTGLICAVSPIYIGITQGNIRAALPGNPGREAKSHGLSLIPAGARVSASNEIGTYVSARRYVYTFPALRWANWLIVDVNDRTYADKTGYRRAVRAVEVRPGWKIIYASHGVDVLQRATSGS
jgi:uncharacterized membrane protein